MQSNSKRLHLLFLGFEAFLHGDPVLKQIVTDAGLCFASASWLWGNG